MENKAIRPTKPPVQARRERARKKEQHEDGTDIAAGLDKQRPGTNEPTVFNQPRPDSPGYGGSDTSPPGTGYSSQ